MLESALGDGRKKIEDNEQQTVVLQRRCVRAAKDILAGTTLSREDLEVLRPAPRDAIPAHEVTAVVDHTAVRDLVRGEAITWADLQP